MLIAKPTIEARMELSMPNPEHRKSPARGILAAVLSIVLHVGLFLMFLSYGGRYDGVDDGNTPLTRLVFLESRDADHRDGVDAPPLKPTIPQIKAAEPALDENREPPLPPVSEPPLAAAAPAATPPLELTAATDSAPSEIAEATPTDAPPTLLPGMDQAAFVDTLAHLAEQLVAKSQSHATWEQDGKQFSATLVLERAKNGSEFDQVVAEVSAEQHGKQITTQVNLKRLAFSYFTQMIDYWDPMVQLHDDEIIGRMHINSRFNLFYDRRVAPKILGKVTTAASSFDMQSSGRSREADVFRSGVETRSRRIALPQEVQPFAWAKRNTSDRVHELVDDTDIIFFPDGSYWWRDHNAREGQYRNEPTRQPIYFLGTLSTTIYVKGVVSGTVLIYSPRRIVVEGSLTYAHDPRQTANSPDYLGLVSDRYIEIAPPHITGAGDLDIHAAIYAGRRFTVSAIDRGRPATLRIYGSLSAGSISASEPRYATKIEYDSRFDRQRPPGFPSTNRFAAEDWDGRWEESAEPSEQSAAGSF